MQITPMMVSASLLMLLPSPGLAGVKAQALEDQKVDISQRTALTISALKPELGRVFARAVLEPKNNSQAKGVVLFAKTDFGVNVLVTVEGVAPGLKGIHVHEFGDCSADDASSAGDHYNPGNKPHGHIGFHGVHAGDFGNIPVDQDGHGLLNVVMNEQMNLGLDDWQEFIGRSLVLHDGKDDLISQPSGESGDRIACGVIQKI